jgi:hypothetical protein
VRWRLNLQNLMRLALEILHSNAMFALVFQGISGLIQLKAFIAFSGADYLAFSAAYLAGSMLAILVALNFENMILGGRWTRSVRNYVTAIWLLGMIAALITWRMSGTGPHMALSVVVFCSLNVCSRIFLAWASHARPSTFGPSIAAAFVVAICLLGDFSLVLIAALIAFPLVAWRAQGPLAQDGVGLRQVLVTSTAEFLGYLPHTLSGLAIGYLDRFVALSIVGGVEAEGYLRTVQIFSWAAFVAYPVVFYSRSRVLKSEKLNASALFRSVFLLAAVIAAAVLMILIVFWLTGRMTSFSFFALVLVFLAIVCSQSYQMVSPLNFINNRFNTVNRISLSSAAVVTALALTLVPTWRTSEAMSLVLLSGWSVQLVLTVSALQRR